jgi:hypothetical protein
MKTQNKITDAALIEAGFNDETEQNQVRALCAFLDCEPEDLSKLDYNHYGALSIYKIGAREYAIGTDEEADKAAANYIEDSIWAFNASFLASFTGLPEEMFSGMQDKCEGANDAFKTCVELAKGGMAAFVSEAISADGRGHFMSSYDGEENDVEINGTRFYIYRIN